MRQKVQISVVDSSQIEANIDTTVAANLVLKMVT